MCGGAGSTRGRRLLMMNAASTIAAAITTAMKTPVKERMMALFCLHAILLRSDAADPRLCVVRTAHALPRPRRFLHHRRERRRDGALSRAARAGAGDRHAGDHRRD